MCLEGHLPGEQQNTAGVCMHMHTDTLTAASVSPSHGAREGWRLRIAGTLVPRKTDLRVGEEVTISK